MPHNFLSRRARFLQAVGFVVVGFLAYSIGDLCSKKLQDAYNVHQILGVSGLIGMIVTGIWLYAKYGLQSFFPKNLKLHLLRSAVVFCTSYFIVCSLRTLPLADFYGIIFTIPFFVMIFAIFMLDEKIGWRRWAATFVGFLGIIVLAGPQFNQLGEGVIYAVIGAMFSALNMVMLKKIGDAPVPLYGFYASAAIGLINLAIAAALGLFQPFTMEWMPYYALHGPIILLGLLCLSIGFSRAPETVMVAPFQYTQVIWGVLFGWMFFHTIPTPTTWAGLAMVIGAGLYSLRREYKHAHHID